MKRYSYIKAFILSFFSKDLYLDVVENWKGSGLLFLFVLLLLSWVPWTIALQIKIHNYIKNEGPALISQIPDIKITNGEATINKPSPCFFSLPFKGGRRVNIIIDTSGGINDIKGQNANVLLTRNKLFLKNGRNQISVYSLSKGKNYNIDRNFIEKFTKTIDASLALLSYPFVVLFSFISRVFQLLLYSLAGVLLARNFKLNLEYQAITRLTAVAMTPAIIIYSLFHAFSIKIPLWTLISILLTLFYIYSGLKEISGKGLKKNLELP